MLAEPLTRADVIGTFAGLRPLLTSAHDDDETSDLSPQARHPRIG